MLICVDLDGTLLDTVPANAAMNITPSAATAGTTRGFCRR